MKTLNPKSILALMCILLLLSWEPAGNSETRRVDLVFCIDLSASTNGILNNVRNRMWNIANGFLNENENTDLRIAVVGYGRPSFGGNDGFVKVITELTNDLDRSSYSLFQLKAIIENGDQFVPNALYETYTQLKWSKGVGAEKIVFLIGNGSVYTGSLNLADICDEYKRNNIKINTIFVTQNERINIQAVGYKKIAEQTNGKFYMMNASYKDAVNKASGASQIALSLNDSLNNTFMFYTKDAEERKKYLLETDKNVLNRGVNYFYSRLLYKTSKHYFESYAPFDLTAYLNKYDKMPDRINSDFLGKAEKTLNITEIEKHARKKAVDRIRLSEEIKNIFNRIDNDSSPSDTLLDTFVLESNK
ncbi:MAG: vWA domain-containing protein [Bacteroidia bacterium]